MPAIAPDVSVILPAKDEAANLPLVVRDIAEALAGTPHEIIVVDDGSTDATEAAMRDLAATVPGLCLIRHAASCGQSAALRTGVMAARGRIIATLDADGQNPASNLPRLVAPFLAPDADPQLGLVQGQRLRRQDTWSKRMGSRLANAIRNALLNDGVRDSGCGMKAFPRAVYLELAYFDHLHRFMPAMVKREGLSVMVMDVTHAERHAGRSNYSNTRRALVGIVDLVGVAWLMRRRRLAASSVVLRDTGPDGPGSR
jgi:dolichol-phosphate mannosyltransferase